MAHLKNVPVSSPAVTHAFLMDCCAHGQMTSLSQPFQTTPARTWENTVPCNAQWDTSGMTLAVRCVSAAYPCPSVDL